MASADAEQWWRPNNGDEKRSHAATSARVAGIASYTHLEHGERFQYHKQPLVRSSRFHAAGLRHIAQVIIHFLATVLRPDPT